MRRFFLPLLLIITLILGSCQITNPESICSQSFSSFTNEIFRSWVSSDSLTLNCMLKNPSHYKISKLPKGFFPSSSQGTTSPMETENLLQRVNSYKKENLSTQEQILQDTLSDYLEMELKSETYEHFANILDPSSGIQAQLPVLLAEFHWDSEDDVEQYFLLLQSTPAYFTELLEAMNNKKNSSTLPCKSALLAVIQQCDDFVNKQGTSAIQTSFNKKIQKLFPHKASSYIQEHNSSLTRYLIPAYKNLSAGLTALLPDAPEDGALAAYPNGSDYYDFLFRKKSGSSQPVSYWEKQLMLRLKEAETELLSCAATEPSALRTCQDYEKKYSSPGEILQTLQEKMKQDFPDCAATTYQLHTVDDTLEDYLSPAFYLTPPIDDISNNAIYINGSDKYKHSSLFNTLAHEGYPGHLYQNCYLRGKKLPLLRHLLDYPGYTEGYATYAEIYSYRYSGARDMEVKVLQNNAIATHCVYALCDIGIHKKHWSLDALSSFLSQHGYPGKENASRIYQSVIHSPGAYIPYTIGYLQLEQLRKKFSSDKEFHTYVLNMGPSSFDVLEKYFQKQK